MAGYRDFSEAPPLKNFQGRNLLEDYDYQRSNGRALFSSITRENLRIQKVVKVYNPQLYGLYLLYKEELKNIESYSSKLKENMLYHATSPRSAESIARNNIDWRKTARSRFGQGACFSRCPRYAHTYASSTGAFVICRVLVKESEEVGVCYGLRVPSEVIYDTVLGGNQLNIVTVKFDDFNFYPQFIVYYI